MLPPARQVSKVVLQLLATAMLSAAGLLSSGLSQALKRGSTNWNLILSSTLSSWASPGSAASAAILLHGWASFSLLGEAQSMDCGATDCLLSGAGEDCCSAWAGPGTACIALLPCSSTSEAVRLLRRRLPCCTAAQLVLFRLLLSPAMADRSAASHKLSDSRFESQPGEHAHVSLLLDIKLAASAGHIQQLNSGS